MSRHDETETIPIVEEQLSVSKRAVDRQVRIRTVTEDFDEVMREEIFGERIDVQHIAVERELSETPEVRFEGDLMIIPVIEERLVIEKRLFLIEEVHVRRLQGVERIERPVRLRKQRVIVERSGGDQPED